MSQYLHNDKELGELLYSIINEYNALNDQEKFEVCQFLKFITTKFDSRIRFIAKPQPPAPDFIIRHENEKIGLEHTRILTDSKDYDQIKTLLEKARQLFEEEYPGTNVCAIFSIENNEWNYKTSEKKTLAAQIAKIVHCKLQKENVEYLNKISSIEIQPHDKVTFSFDGDIDLRSQYLSKSKLDQAVKKKEEKIKSYMENEYQLSKIWLLLIVNSLSSNSYKIDPTIDYSLNSKFDRVYLMSDFEAQVIRVK